MMDPDANWEEQRRLEKSGKDPKRLAELVQALNEWIARGGFPPKAWKQQKP